MDDTKREELEKACKKIHKVRFRMIAVRTVRVSNMSVEKIASIQIRCPRGPATGCAVTTKEALKVSGIFPDAAGPEEFCEV